MWSTRSLAGLIKVLAFVTGSMLDIARMRITGAARLAGIMGWPVAHSRSPLLHGFWLDQNGIDGAYVPLPVRPGDIEQALRSLPILGFRGCNLTIPHKQAALEVVDRVDPLARRIGAVNTIVVAEDGSLGASNTDIYGFRENLRERAPAWEPLAGAAVVLGAGGSSRAVIAALVDAGVGEIRIINRTLSRAETVAANLMTTAHTDHGSSLGPDPCGAGGCRAAGQYDESRHDVANRHSTLICRRCRYRRRLLISSTSRSKRSCWPRLANAVIPWSMASACCCIRADRGSRHGSASRSRSRPNCGRRS